MNVNYRMPPVDEEPPIGGNQGDPNEEEEPPGGK